MKERKKRKVQNEVVRGCRRQFEKMRATICREKTRNRKKWKLSQGHLWSVGILKGVQ